MLLRSNVLVVLSYLVFSTQARLYSQDHCWVTIDDGVATVGITDYSQKFMRYIVYVDLIPEVGDVIESDEAIGSVEAVMAASDVYSPVGGIVTQVNTNLYDHPELINTSPLDKGWLVKLKLSPDGLPKDLMNETTYKKHIRTR